MDTEQIERVKTECEALTDIAPRVDFHPGRGIVAVKAVPFPRGWNLDTGTLMFNLPDTYPEHQPHVYIPEQARYRGSKPRIMLKRGPDGWSKHCIHEFSDEWDPQRHTLVTIFGMVEDSLKKPNSSDPWKDY